MQPKITSCRKKWPWTVLAVALLMILWVGVGQASAAGSISGKVTRDSDGTVIQGIVLYIYDQSWNFLNWTQTDSSGNYTIGSLAAGSYYLRTWNDQGYFDEYYTNVPVVGSPWPPTGATAVSVAANSNTPNINFSLALSNSISGQVVKDTGGSGIENVNIFVYDLSGNLVTNTEWTDSSGNYSVVGLLAGSYYVRTWNNQGYIDEYYNNVPVPGTSWPPAGATTVSVTAGSNTPNINFGLALGGSISGRVVKSLDGTGIQGIDIHVFLSNHFQLNWTQTDSSGNYTVGNLPTASYYVMTSNSRGYIDEYYNNVPVAGSSWPPAGATGVSVTVGSTTPNINFALGKRQKTVADYDGDHKTDVGVYRINTGAWYMVLSSSGTVYGTGWGGMPGDIPVPADYDGDGLIDIGIYRNGAWFIIKSSTGESYGVGWGGDPSDMPIPADYDGDGKADIAVYRKSTGAWYGIQSSTGNIFGLGWGGMAGDIPVPADYDGDGKTDVAVYRNGAWFIIKSSTGEVYGVGWGGDPSDMPIPADYDGDGKADIAVYRKSTGAWYGIQSSTGNIFGLGWGGMAQDIPVPGDYDGDGKVDIAVYRNGAWFIIKSSTGQSYGVGWGGDPSDIPLNPTAILYHYY